MIAQNVVLVIICYEQISQRNFCLKKIGIIYLSINISKGHCNI